LRKKESKRKEGRFRTKNGEEQDERIICYGRKKPRHFKLECPDQVEEKEEKEKKKFSKKKRVLCQPGRIWIHPALIMKKSQT